MKTKVESFEDIVFENRNKEYGAYELRRKYAKRATIALIIAVSMFFLAVGVPLLANIMNNDKVLKYIENETLIDLMKVKTDEEPKEIPLPPDPPAPIKEFIFIAPRIVDSITDPFEGEIFNYDSIMNTPIDTASPNVVVGGIEFVPKPEKDFEIIEINEKPYFEGGDAALIRFVAENTIYPPLAIETGIEGTVYIRFVVTKSGKIGKTIIARSADPLLDQEALRVVKLLPEWTPGKINGNPVNVWFIIPVKFKLEK